MLISIGISGNVNTSLSRRIEREQSETSTPVHCLRLGINKSIALGDGGHHGNQRPIRVPCFSPFLSPSCSLFVSHFSLSLSVCLSFLTLSLRHIYTCTHLLLLVLLYNFSLSRSLSSSLFSLLLEHVYVPYYSPSFSFPDSRTSTSLSTFLPTFKTRSSLFHPLFPVSLLFFSFSFFFFSSLILAHVTSNPLFSSLSPFSRTFSTLYLPPFSGFSFSFAHPTFNHFFFFLFFFSFLLSFEHCYAIFFCFLIPPYIQTILYFHSLSPVFVSFPDHFLSKISLFSTRTSHYSISLFYNYYILLIIITFYLLENILLYFLYFIYFLTSLFIIYICII